MRKVLLSLVVVSLIAIPALAGKYNKVISVGHKALTSRASPRSPTVKTPASAWLTSRKTWSSSSSWPTTARSSWLTKIA